MRKLEIILRNLKRIEFEPRFRKRVFSFLFLAVFGFLLIGGLGIWGAVTAYKSIAGISVSSDVQNQITNLKQELTEFPTMNSLSCFDKIQTLVGLRTWLDKPVSQNLSALKNACLESKINNDKGPE